MYTNDNNQYSYNIQNKLQFSKAFNPDNRLNALLGMELRSSTAKGTANKVWGYVPDRGERIVAPTIPSEVITPNNPPTCLLYTSMCIRDSLNTHPWDEGIAEIQISCGAYSIQDNLSKEKRMQMNTSTGKHLQFLTQMAVSSPVFKLLFKNYHNHYIQVESLVKQMAKEINEQQQ